MPNIYMKADSDNSAIAHVAHTIDSYYPDLKKVGLKYGILFAISANESPALKENGHPTEGTIKIVSSKDRVTKEFDVEIILDGTEWQNGREQHHLALIDSLLARLEVKRRKLKKKKNKKGKGSDGAVHGTDEERKAHEEEEFITDDIGRPVLKLRKGDWNSGMGFREVVERHGGFSVEHRRLESINAIVDAAIAVFNAAVVPETAVVQPTTPVTWLPPTAAASI